MNRTQKKSDFLGMNFSTAERQLRKSIIFKLLEEANKDSCYRCQQKIETVDEMSIEHIEPWEGRDPALFWSLSNISFSHVDCNRPHTKIERPDGFSWCGSCKQFLPVERFGKNKAKWHGYQNSCNECRSKHYALRVG